MWSRCARPRPPSSRADGRADVRRPAGAGAGESESEPGLAARAAAIAARDSYGRLAASTGDLAAAQDVLADAFERALRTWPSQGVPGNPSAWLLTVARNRMRDEWKSARAQRTVPLDADRDSRAYLEDIDVDAIPDRRLELMLVCASGDRTGGTHPADAQHGARIHRRDQPSAVEKRQ
ncbi:hypothetical protein MXD59_14825 [Frankia sp. Ag45/Mut15]|uniref:RNA polymerase sigma-70 region 2 domain-containing protein n=1 Tax=Frankia umida TaxID=573489 RepID=A0ABT0JZR6_9ACTN|nr:sigma factor [Frankia umida]MCK9877031.1 hypothetical protein [Frankia umida]